MNKKTIKTVMGKERDEIVSYFKESLGASSWDVREVEKPSFWYKELLSREGKTKFYFLETEETYKRTYKQIVDFICSKKQFLKHKERILYIGAIVEQQIETLNGITYRFIIQLAGF